MPSSNGTPEIREYFKASQTVLFPKALGCCPFYIQWVTLAGRLGWLKGEVPSLEVVSMSCPQQNLGKAGRDFDFSFNS
jgi:hypothetical protein